MPSCGCCDIEACCCTVRPTDTITWRPSLSSHGFYSFFMVSLFLQSQPSLGSALSVLFFPELQWQWEDGRRRRRREEEENKHHIGGSEEGGTNWEGAVSSFSTEQHTSKKVRTNHNLIYMFTRLCVIWLMQAANRRGEQGSEVILPRGHNTDNGVSVT